MSGEEIIERLRSPRLLTATEVAEICGVEKRWVYRHASTAESPLQPVIPAVNLGGVVRFRPETLLRFIEECEG